MNNQIQPDFSLASDFTCEQCQCKVFVVRYRIKHFSELASPSGGEMLVPIQVFACSDCGFIDDQFLPNE